MDDTLRHQLEALLDRQAIHDCLMTYSRAIDRLDRDMLLSVYHSDAVDDHGAFVGSAKAFADWAIAMHRRMHLSHQHCQFNSTCDLDGDVAHTETYYMFVGLNQRGKPFVMSGGRYIDRLEKREGRWAIAVRLCIRDWAPLDTIPDSLDQAAMTAAPLDDQTRALIRGGPPPTRDADDPSYQRPLTIPAERLAQGSSQLS